MSSLDRDDVKERIKQATDIVDLVGSYLPLQRQGAAFKGLCPFHDDTSPSLQINPARQSWRCWVCDMGGDIFSFVMKREGLGFREALELLADRAGIELSSAPKPAPGTPGDRGMLRRAMAWAERQFYECLLNAPEAEPARRYLDDRGISESSIHRFHLGFAPNDFHWLHHRARDTEFTPQVLVAAGLLRQSQRGEYYDFYRGRLMFSIRDEQSRPIAAGGRILPEFDDGKSGKYVNSPETKLFNKSEQLYAFDLARDDPRSRQSLAVVEGYTDVVMAHQMGLANVVAVLGTSLTQRHIRRLKRSTERVHLVLDGDAAGQRRASDVLDMFVAEDVDLRIATLPEGADPCDFLLQNGSEAFTAALEEAPDALEHRFRVSTLGVNLSQDVHGANQALESILATLAKAPVASSDSARMLRRQQMLARLARLFHIAEDDVRLRLRALSRPTPQPSQIEAKEETVAPRFRFADISVHDRELLEVLVERADLREAAKRQVVPADLSSDTARAIFDVLLAMPTEENFASILTQTDDFDLKSILVRLDEDAGKKSVHAQMDAPARLDDFIKHLALRKAAIRKQESGRALTGGQFASDAEEDQQLSDFFSQLAEIQSLERRRQGMSEPTDG